VLSDPTRQYNSDETGFQLDPKTGKVLALRGEIVYTEAGGNKEQVTVLVTTRADGKIMMPTIVYPYKKFVPKVIVDKIPKGYCIAKSNSGWMTSEIFYEYIANIFIPELATMRRAAKGIEADENLLLDESDWVVLWIDGYKSHLTLHKSQLCHANKIVLYCFKAHSSHICQPNDVGPFKPLKAEWRDAVKDWRLDHPYETLTRISFAEVMAKAIAKLNPKAIISGYRATELYPFDANAVHYERLTASNHSKFDIRAFGKQEKEKEESAFTTALNVFELAVGSGIIRLYEEIT